MYLVALEMFFDSSNIGLNIPHACAQFVSLIFQLSKRDLNHMPPQLHTII